MNLIRFFRTCPRYVHAALILFSMSFVWSNHLHAQSNCDLYVDFVTHPSTCHGYDGSFIAYATDQPGNSCQRKIEVYEGNFLVATGYEELAVTNLGTGNYEIIAYNECGCGQVQSEIVEISGGTPTELIPMIDLGGGFLKLTKASVCKGSSVKIGVQSLGLQNFIIQGPNGFSSVVPNGSTFWELNNVQPIQSGNYRIQHTNNQGCTSFTNFLLTVKDLRVDLGSNATICKGERKNIIPQVSGQSICRGTCDETTADRLLVKWDLNFCNAQGFANQNDYREFKPKYPDDGGCFDVQASNVYREQGSHSCTPSVDFVGLCVPALDACDPAFYNPVNAIKFSLDISPSKTSRLTKLSFFEQSPLIWQTTDGNSGINNYNTKFLVKVYKNGNLIYQNDTFETKRNWGLVEIDFSEIAEFTSHEFAHYEFEMMGYCVVDRGGNMSGWEIDDVRIFGTCCTDAPIFDDVTYVWSDGSTDPILRVKPQVSTKYFVTITDCEGCRALDSVQIFVEDLPEVDIMVSRTTICAGETVTLTASGGDSYLWSNGQTTASIQVSPSVTTEYSVLVFSANGCESIGTVTVFVTNAGTITITGLDSVCEGGSVTLVASGGVSYIWSNGSTDNSITVTPTATTTYTVTATDAGGCIGTASKTVGVLPVPVITITGPDSVCEGGSVTLVASGGASYIWSNGSTDNFITVSPTATITYSVTATDSGGCIGTASKTVGVFPSPVITITGPNSVCQGGSVTLAASGGVSYIWSNGSTDNSITVTPTTTTTYSVTATDGGGCIGTASKTVGVLPVPVITITGPESVCEGGSVTLVASGGASYIWSNGSTDNSITVSPTTTTTYTVTATDSGGCIGTASKTVSVLPSPVITITGPDSVCEGGSVTLAASGGVSYIWSNGSTDNSITVTPTTTTTYSVTATDAGGCIGTATKTVSVLPSPVITITGPESVCEGGSVNLVASGGASYIWSNGSTDNSITVTPTATTTYSVTATDAGGCIGTASKTVNVLPNPVVTITGGGSICLGESITLQANGGSNYVWSTGATTSSITVSPTSTTTYSVSVEGSGECGGSASTEVIVLPLPEIEITGRDTICVGECTELTATGGILYEWDFEGDNCQGSYFVGGLQNNGPQSLYRQRGTGDLQEIGATGTTRLNGIGYYCNGDNGELYGMIRKGDDITTAIRADFASINPNTGATTTLGEIPLPPNPYGLGGVSGIMNFIGEVTPEGDYLFPAMSALINPFTFQIEQYKVYIGKINVNNHGNGSNVTYTELTLDASCDVYMDMCVEAFRVYALNPAGREPSGGIQDWVLDESSNNLYAFLGIENALLRIDLTTLTAYCTAGPGSNSTYTGTVGVQTDEFGGMYYEGGKLYGWQVDRGRIFEIDETTAALTLVKSGLPVDYRGDNATCKPCGGDYEEPSIEVCPEETTTYTVTVTDANGCSATKSITVVVRESLDVTITGGGSICLGESITLQANGGSNYVWSTGATTSSITVSPTSTTTYSVSVEGSGECGGSASTQVIVLPLPEIEITGRDTICVGECTELTATGGILYEWDLEGDNCQGSYFVGGLQNNGPQSLYRQRGTGDLQEIGATGTTRLNGIGYYCNGDNGELYGMIRKGDDITTAIRADFASINPNTGATTTLGEIPLPPNPYGLGGVSGIMNFIGEVTPEGDYLFPAMSALINPFTFQIEQYKVYIGKINVNNHGNGSNVTYTELTLDASCDVYMDMCVEAFRVYALNPAGREPSGGIQDWVLDESSNNLYAFLGIENALLRIDLTTLTAYCTAGPSSNSTYTGTVGVQTDEFGGMYYEGGKLYGWQVDRGRIFEIDETTAVLTLVKSGLPVDYRGDNATCKPCGGDYEEPSIEVCPEETTTYTVTVTDANGCSATKSITVVVRESLDVTITGGGSICLGESITLQANGGSNYVWSTGETSSSITVSPTSTTTYSVSVEGSGECGGSGTAQVIVLPLPEIEITGRDTICVGECTELTATGGILYEWDFEGDNCQGSYFVGGLQNNGPQSLYRQRGTGDLQEIGATGTTRLNGIGYYCNGDNGELYGMIRKGDDITTAIRADFARINPNTGATTTLGEIALPPNPYGLGGVSGIMNFIGEVTPEGDYLFPAMSALINPFTFQIEQYKVYIGKINVNNHGNGSNVTYTELTLDASCDVYMDMCVEAFRVYALNPAGREPSGGIQDWVLDESSNNLYAFLGIENALLRIDLTTLTAYCIAGPGSNSTYTGTVGAQTDEFGGMYYEGGKLYGWQVDRGRIFEIDETTAALTLVKSGLPVDYRGDNATCKPCGGDYEEPSIEVCPEETTTYTVRVTDANGCSATKSITVVVRESLDVTITGGGSICLGESITLQANGGSNYVWSTGATTSSITVSPTSTTTYSVSVEGSGECGGSASTEVIVLPLPEIEITGRDTICVGECTELTATGGILYEWDLEGDNCQGSYFVGGLQNNGPQSLYRQRGTGDLQEIGATGTTRLNGIGYYCNGDNGELYGMIRKGDDITTAIRADFASINPNTGATTTLGEIPLPPNPYGLGGVSGIMNFIGEVTPEGDYIFPAMSALINPFTFQIEQYKVYIGKINVNNHGNGSNVTYTELTLDASCDVYMDMCVEAFRVYALNPAGREPSGGIQDWVLDESSNNLYAFLGIENALLRIDLTTLTAYCTAGPGSNSTYTGTVGVQTDEFGGMYYEGGKLYGWQVDRGRIFEIDETTAALTLVKSGLPVDYRGDNATCKPCGGDYEEPSIEVCPEETTTYTVRVTDANGCRATKSITVVVRDFEGGQISGIKEICYSERTTLTAPVGVSYLWSNGSVSSSITVSPTTTTSYSVTVTRTDKCDIIAHATVIVHPYPNIQISGATEVCEGNCTTLIASGGQKYEWSGGGILSENAQIEVCPDTATQYFVKVTNGKGCSDTDSIIVNVKEQYTSVISGIAQICVGESSVLTVTEGDSYHWSTGATTQSITVNPIQTTNYLVTVTKAGFCDALATFEVEVLSGPTFEITGKDSICGGGCTRLEATIGLSYNWTGPSLQSNENYIEICPDTTTLYYLTVTGSNGCSSTVVKTVYVMNKINVGVSADTAICSGEEVVLTVFGGSSYQWSTGEQQSSITVAPGQTTEYSVTVSEENTCTEVRRVKITVLDSPEIVVEGDENICDGGCTTLTASGGDNYFWSGAGFTSEQASFEICPEVDTWVTLVVTNSNGCSKTKEILVRVVTPGVLTISGDSEICEGETVDLTVSGGVSYTWNTGATTSTIQVKPDVTTTYTVTSLDSSGCLIFATKQVKVSANPVIFIVYNSEICEGNSVVIRASGGTKYNWNTGDSTAIIIPTPTTTTRYIVTVTNLAGCSSVDSVEVMVKPKPVIHISGHSQICYQDSATIVASVENINLCPEEYVVEIPDVLAYWDLADCHSFMAQGTHLDYTEFLPVTETGSCINVSASNVSRRVGPHSCSYGPNGTDIAMCVGGQSTCNSSKLNYDEALRFKVAVNPGQTGRLTGLQFYETSPEQFVWVLGDNGPNDYLQKFAIRVLRDGKIVYFEDEIPSLRHWNLVTFDFADDPSFAFSKQTVFEFEILAYCPIGNGADQSVWDIDEIKVLGGCSPVGNPGDVTYSWSTGSDLPGFKVSPEETSTYTVTATDCCGCTSTADFTVQVNNIKVDLGPDVMITEGQSITIKPEITGNSNCEAGITALTYKWSTGATSDSIIVSPAVSYVYNLEVEDCLECKGKGRKFVFVNPENQNLAVVYPNPTAGKFQLLSYEKLEGDISIQFFGVDGKLVGRNEIPYKKISEYHIEVDLPDHVQSGPYIIELNNNGAVSRTQVIVIDR